MLNYPITDGVCSSMGHLVTTCHRSRRKIYCRLIKIITDDRWLNAVVKDGHWPPLSASVPVDPLLQ